MPNPLPWYKVQAAVEDQVGVVSIRGYIGEWDVNDRDFIASVESLGDVNEITVRINSRGGEVDHALSIFSYLKSHPAKIIVHVDGVAMSAASIIAMAGDEIIMPANTLMMIHNPWTVAVGSADEIRKQADELEKFEMALRETYVARTGLSEDEVKDLLDDTTYMTAKEAVEWGFADKVGSLERQETASAAVAYAAALSIPDDVIAKIAAEQAGDDNEPADSQDEPVSGTDADTDTDADTEDADTDQSDELIVGNTQMIIAAVESAGLSEYADVFALDDSLNDANALACAIAEAREVVELSALVGKSEMASAMIRSRKTLAEAKSQLQEAIALEDEQSPIDNLIPSGGHQADPPKSKPVKTSTIWAERSARNANRR